MSVSQSRRTLIAFLGTLTSGQIGLAAKKRKKRRKVRCQRQKLTCGSHTFCCPDNSVCCLADQSNVRGCSSPGYSVCCKQSKTIYSAFPDSWRCCIDRYTGIDGACPETHPQCCNESCCESGATCGDPARCYRRVTLPPGVTADDDSAELVARNNAREFIAAPKEQRRGNS